MKAALHTDALVELAFLGIGRELGAWGLENYLEVQQITAYDGSQPWGWYRKD